MSDPAHAPQIRRQVYDVLRPDVKPDGSLGLFHPDNMRGKTTLKIDEIVSKVSKFQGVIDAKLFEFRRADTPFSSPVARSNLKKGVIEFRISETPTVIEGRRTDSIGMQIRVEDKASK